MIPPLRFTASPEDASQRLDNLLRERFPQFSRARVQEWIRSGGVRVAGLPSRASHTVRAGESIEVEPAEPFAANALLVGETVIYQPAFPKTLLRLEAAGMHARLLDQSELAKAEGALTCCSLIFKKQG